MTFHRTVVAAIAATTACFLALDAASAARMEDLHATRNIDNINKQHGPTSATLNPRAKARRHAEILNVPPDSTLVQLQDPKKDKVGSYYRYQQLFHGVPVYGADLTVSEDTNGNLASVFGQLAQDLANDLSSTAANLSAQEALAIAKRSALTGNNSNTPTERETAEKMIYIDDSGAAHVVYKTIFFIAHPSEPTAPAFLIDANTGEVLEQWDTAENANAPGELQDDLARHPRKHVHTQYWRQQTIAHIARIKDPVGARKWDNVAATAAQSIPLNACITLAHSR